jgi:filamentous hemagglutinin family protein
VNRPLGSRLRAWCYAWRVPVAALAPLLCAGPVFANPLNGQVVGGQATIATTAPNTLTINQTTPRAAIDWQSFNIAPNETTQFVQPSANAVALNRVQAGDPSVIAGRLTANGQLVLINPSGIVFTRGSQVNVNSLVATTAGMSAANFMAGNMVFDQPGNPNARVVNNGSITVAQAGLAALVAPGVANNGVIAAKLGQVILGGTQTYTLDFYGDGLIQFAVGSPVAAVPVGRNGQQLTSLVSNTGQINAPGGTVLLTANAVSGILDHVIDSPGMINAPTYAQTPGSVTLDAGPGNTAQLSGTINVAGLSPGQTGGNAVVTGGSVALTSTARIDARGYSGGGSVAIGGGPHGQDSLVRDALTANISAGAVIDASALSGNGGNVTVWSDTTTTFAGTILANGGPQGGNGGTIETSGGQLVLGPDAVVSAAAPLGKAGTWLLDPTNLTIDSTAATTISATLNGGTDVTEQTNGDGTTSGFGTTATGNGDIDVTGAIAWSTANTLTLSAYNNITVSAPITVSGAGNLVLTYNNNQGGTNTAGALTFVMGQGSAQFPLADEASNPKLYINNGTPVAGNGTQYTLIYNLGSGADGIQSLNGSSGNFALAQPLDATSLGTVGTALIPNFNGNFNGLGNIVSNLTIGGTITSSCSVIVSPCAGLFGQLNSGGTISNIGLVGGSITDTRFTAIDGELVGVNEGTISNSYSTGTVTGGNAGAAGGLVGYNFRTGTITASYATGAVTVSANAGLLGGLVGQSDGAITNSYATGAVAGASNSDVGGLTGGGNAGFTVTDSFATGHVSGGSVNGGLVASGSGTITNGYYDSTTTGQPQGTQGNGSVGLTTAELGSMLPTGFSPTVWGNVNNQTTPYLITNPGPVILGTDTSATPTFYTLVFTPTQLQAINNNTSANYLLAQDIDMTGVTGFAPLALNGGIFNGLGNVVANLTINTGAHDAGLFGTSSGTIENLGVIGGSVTTSDVTGIVGGLVGATSGTITNSYSTATVIGPPGSGAAIIGGLVGINAGSITASYATGSVIGGIADFAGGFVGQTSPGSSIADAYATGAVIGNRVGGFAGDGDGGSITNAYSAGAVTGIGTAQLVGGFAGDSGTSVSNAYWNEDRAGTGNTGTGSGPTITGITPLSGTQPFTATSFSGFIFTNIPNSTPGSTPNEWVNVDTDGSIGNESGAGATMPMLASEYQTTIQNAHQLQLMVMDLNANYTLGRNIDATATGSSTGATTGTDVWGPGGFVPIGGNAHGPYNGTFNGAGNTITNLTINADAPASAPAYQFYVGLFGQNFGTIENVGLIGGSITKINGLPGDAVGPLVGYNAGTISDAFSSASVNGGENTGGLVGWNAGGSITDAYAIGSVTGPDVVGGLVGQGGGTITDAFAMGVVSGGGPTGGLEGLGSPNAVIDGYYDAGTTGRALGMQGDGSVGMPTAALQTLVLSTALVNPGNWGIVTGKSYPYLCFEFSNCGTTPQVVAGTVFIDQGQTPAGSGITVSGLVNGVAFVSAQTGGTVATGANGYYYYLIAPNTIPVGGNVLTYAQNYPVSGGTANGATLADQVTTGNATGLDIYANTLHEITGQTFNSAVQADLVTAEGSNPIVSGSSGLVALLANLQIDDSGSFIIDTAISYPSGSVTLKSAGGITELAATITARSLAVNAVDSVDLPQANMVRTLAANVTGAGSSFDFLDGETLRVGTVNNLLSGVTTNGTNGSEANIVLETTAGSIFIDQPISTNGAHGDRLGRSLGQIGLMSAGGITINPFGNGNLVAFAVEAFAASTIDLDGSETFSGNRIGGGDLHGIAQTAGTFSGEVTGAGKSLTFVDQNASLVVDQVTSTGIGGVSAGSLTLPYVSGVITNGGAITLVANQTLGFQPLTTLTLNLPVNANDGAALLGASPGLVQLISTGSDITQTASGTVVAGQLLAESDGNIILTAANHVGANDNSSGIAASAGLVAGFAFGNFQFVNYNAGITIDTLSCGCSGIFTALGNIDLTTTGVGAITINLPINASNGSVTAAAIGDLTIGANGSVTGDSVTLATLTGFINYAGPAAITIGTDGQWLIYSPNPTADTYDGLIPAFIQYAATYPIGMPGTPTAPDAPGDGFLYSEAPQITVNSVSKIYDGTTALPSSPAAYTFGGGGINGDTVTVNVSGATGSFASANAGSGIDVTLTGITLNANNNGTPVYGYSLVNANGGAIGTINPAVLTAMIVNNPSKIYDGTSAAVLASSNYSLGGFVSGQGASVTQTAGSYATANVGSGIALSASLAASNFAANSGTLLSNYVLPTLAMGAGTITPATLTATIANNPSKVYDGTTAATLATSNFSLSGFAAGQGASVTQTAGTYATANAGTGIAVSTSLTAANIAANGGTLLSNYVLPTLATGTGTITPATLTATIVNNPSKVYDGTNTALLASSNYSLGGFVSGQGASVTQTTGIYATASAGSGIALSAGLAAANFAANGGTLLSNYILPTLATGAGTITPATLTAQLTGTVSKVFDGTTAATLTPANYILLGAVSGDTVSLNDPIFGTYASKNIGSGIDVSVSGLALSGLSAGNYVLASTLANADIGSIIAARFVPIPELLISSQPQPVAEYEMPFVQPFFYQPSQPLILPPDASP